MKTNNRGNERQGSASDIVGMVLKRKAHLNVPGKNRIQLLSELLLSISAATLVSIQKFHFSITGVSGLF